MVEVRSSVDWPSGRVIRTPFHSTVLQDNPWRDPVDRELLIYLPPTYDEDTTSFVALWDLAAYTNSGPGHANWSNHGENIPQRLDRLIGLSLMPAAVVVMPDCYTSLGGNQYVNSLSVGYYADYLVEELVPFVNEQFNVVHDRKGRGIFGKSSGGFGALYHAMHWPDTWGAAASHAGDVGFEWVYRPDFPTTAMVLAETDGDTTAFIRQFWNKNRPQGKDFAAMMIIAMAASYDPDKSSPERIRLPFDIHTLEIDDRRWKNWLRFDPLSLVEQHAEALNSLHALYIDVGDSDQYNIQFGTRQLVQKLQAMGVSGRFEEFEGSHSGIGWRLDHSLPYLAHALVQASGRGSAAAPRMSST